MRAINRRIFPIWQTSYQDDKATWSMTDLKAYVVGDVGTTAGLALAAVALVWLIACTNASNLLVARVTSRRRELAVRAALGASRGRVDALSAGGERGACLGRRGRWDWRWRGQAIDLLRGVGANYFPRMQEIALDAPVVWLLVGLTVTSGLIFGLVPALQWNWRAGGRIAAVVRAIHDGQHCGAPPPARAGREPVCRRHAAAGRGRPAARQPERAATGRSGLRQPQRGDWIDSPSGGAVSGSRHRSQSFWDELTRRLEALPGVSGVAFADGRAAQRCRQHQQFRPRGISHTGPGSRNPPRRGSSVTPEYFRVLGLTLLEGRLLDERDAERPNLETVVVDRAWAQRFFPNRSAVGKRFREGGCTSCPWTEVVGVVTGVKYVGLDAPDEGTVYSPMSGSLVRYLVLRTDAEPLNLVAGSAPGRAGARTQRAVLERRDNRRAGRSVARAATIAFDAGCRVCADRAGLVGRRDLRGDGVLRRSSTSRTSAFASRSAEARVTSCGWSSGRA